MKESAVLFHVEGHMDVKSFHGRPYQGLIAGEQILDVDELPVYLQLVRRGAPGGSGLDHGVDAVAVDGIFAVRRIRGQFFEEIYE